MISFSFSDLVNRVNRVRILKLIRDWSFWRFHLLMKQGSYDKIYLKFTILKIYMHRARARGARARAARAKVGRMSQLLTIQPLN